MEKVELSERLKKVASYVKEAEPILDIGSDHAYLPIYLIQQGKVPTAIAGEVVEGPYEKAKNEVDRYNLTEQITTRLGSGFDVLAPEEEIGTVFICGMGGLLISEIIAAGLHDNKISDQTRLVLQPNNKESEVRQVLMNANFNIMDEAIVKENEKFYEIIVAEKSTEKVTYTATELTFGPYLMKHQTPIFQEKWQALHATNQKIMAQLDEEEHKNKRETLKMMNQQIEKVVK